jgi:hypothetical protein
MTSIEKRIERLEEKTGAGREEIPKAIEVCFVAPDGEVKSSFTVGIDYGRRAER